jgi:membrane-associated phospholipid phosphatase
MPFVAILIVILAFVPGSTVPQHTPASLIWRRKLWEFHASTLGFITAHVIAFFFTQGMKNLFGQTRPDFLHRCQPDVRNASDHAVGELFGDSMTGQLYYASICQQKDSDMLDDGFRSYPSGHSSASAAGLVYISLFLASKLTVAIPSVLPGNFSKNISQAAFPSHMVTADPLQEALESSSAPPPRSSKAIYGRQIRDDAPPLSVRKEAAAAPLYLLVVVLAPLALSIYISATRWFDFRHHGFDILFGYLIGLVAAVFSFRYYHLPISRGGGWAWGSRSSDYAFWAGVGRIGYTSQMPAEASRSQRGMDLVEESGTGLVDSRTNVSSTHASNRSSTGGGQRPHPGSNLNDYFDIEMQRIR